MSSPVLIAGAGPTGLYLALLLVRSGIPVRVIDIDLNPQPGSRGTGLQPRTIEIQHMLGVLSEIERQGRQVWRMAAYKPPGGTQVVKEWDFVEQVPNTPNNPMMLGRSIAQNTHTRIIAAELEKSGVHVEKGTAVTSFTQDADGVTCELTIRTKEGTESHETVRTPFLCGADGARGAVRKLLGCTFLGESKDGDVIIVCDVEIKGLSHKTWHVWSNKDKDGVGYHFLVRHLNDHSELMNIACAGFGMDLTSVDIDAPGAFIKFFREQTGRDDLEIGDPVWLSHFRPSMRMVDKFGEGRVFVLGDAAHTHSPTGGQGMNSSIQDALNLYWKLALVYKHLASPTLLSTYTDERLPVIAQMLNKTTELYKATASADQAGDDLATKALFRPRTLFMLGVNYRWSDVVLDTRTPRAEGEATKNRLRMNAYGGYGDAGEEGTVLAAGDRAPDAPMLVSSDAERGPMALFGVFDLVRHTVLFFLPPSSTSNNAGTDAVAAVVKTLKAGLPAPAEELVQTVVLARQALNFSAPALGVDHVLADSEGHAFRGYTVSESEPEDGVTIVVVRPDTYVGAVVRTPEDMMRYFTLVFGAA